MEADINWQNEDVTDVTVTDNNGVTHRIQVAHEGDIYSHHVDAYANDPADRTENESEHGSQARGYARFYVNEQTDHETLAPYETQAGIERAIEAIEAMAEDAFLEEFEAAYEQVTNLAAGREPPVSVPGDVQLDQGGSLARQVLPGLATPDGEMFGRGDVVVILDVYLHDDGTFDAISGLHHRYMDSDGEWHTQWGPDPFTEREPAARLNLWCYPVATKFGFRNFVVYNLRCQIRDLYLGRGLTPPAEYRIVGPGLQELTGRYVHEEVTLYDEYHNFHAVIDGYRREYDPQ